MSIFGLLTRHVNVPWFLYREAPEKTTTGVQDIAFLGDPAIHRILPAEGAAAIVIRGVGPSPMEGLISNRRMVQQRIAATDAGAVQITSNLVDSTLVQAAASDIVWSASDPGA